MHNNHEYRPNRRPIVRSHDKAGVAFVFAWLTALLVGIGVWGVIIWAIINLVQWVTTK
jgi:hypothetical protein